MKTHFLFSVLLLDYFLLVTPFFFSRCNHENEWEKTMRKKNQNNLTFQKQITTFIFMANSSPNIVFLAIVVFISSRYPRSFNPAVYLHSKILRVLFLQGISLFFPLPPLHHSSRRRPEWSVDRPLVDRLVYWRPTKLQYTSRPVDIHIRDGRDA